MATATAAVVERPFRAKQGAQQRSLLSRSSGARNEPNTALAPPCCLCEAGRCGIGSADGVEGPGFVQAGKARGVESHGELFGTDARENLAVHEWRLTSNRRIAAPGEAPRQL
jgi:hypothetical protein